MDSHLKRIYRLNIVTIFLLVIYSGYLLRNVIFILYNEAENKILASILIPIMVVVIITLTLSSNRAIKRDLYDRNIQKWVAILYAFFVFSSDILIIYAFPTFHFLGKAFFILNNISALIYLRRFLISFQTRKDVVF